MDKPNADLLGSPLYRHLMPRRRDIILPGIFYPTLMTIYGYMVVMVIRWQTAQSGRLSQSAGWFVLGIFMGAVFLLAWVLHIRHARREYQKRADRLARIPAQDFWRLESELSLSELRYGTYHLLGDYLYAPHERLLLRYTDIAEWKFADHFSTVSGTLEDQYLVVREKDGFETRILIRRRADLVREHAQALRELNAQIRRARKAHT